MKLSNRLFLWPAAMLGTLLALSGFGAYQLELSNKRTVAQAAQGVLGDTLVKTDALLRRYTYGLLGARGALTVTGVDGMDRETFARYSRSRNHATEFPGARGFGFIRRVKPDQIQQYLESRRRAGWPDFKIRQLQPHREELYVIELLEPYLVNRNAIGLDIGSEQARRFAAQSAMRTGTPTLTGPITLVQAGSKPSQSFLMLLPMYDGSKTEGVGWTYAPLVMGEILEGLGRLPSGRLTMTDTTTIPHTQFYTTGIADSATPIARQSLDIMGRKWKVTFQPSSAFVHQLGLVRPIYAGVTGALLAVLCSALLAAILLDRERKRRLHTSRAQLAAMVEASVDAIIGLNSKGLITSWNPGAENMFGYQAAEAIGHSLIDLTIEPQFLAQEHILLDQVFQGEVVSVAQAQRRRRDGSPLAVSLTIVPMRGESGEFLDASATLRDISALVVAQEEIRNLNSSLEQQVQERTSELEAARRDLRTVLDAVPSMIGYWDHHEVNRFANQAYSKWFGLPAAEIIGKPMQELLGAELYALNRAHVVAALRGEFQQFERAIPHPDGSVRHSLANYLPDIGENGVRGFYVIVHDVSDIIASRTALASALRENDVLIRTINEEMLYSVTDANGRIIEVNNNFCEMVGYERNQLIGQDHRLLSSGEHDSLFWVDMWETITGGRTWHGLICNRSADDRLKWFETVISPYFDEHGDIERYVALRSDVTARVSADTALRHMSALLESVLNAASEIAIIATDQNGFITVFNSGAVQMTGYAAAEMVRLQTPAPLHVPEEVLNRGAELTAQFGELISGFRAFVHVAERTGVETREWTYVRKDGTRLPVSLSVTPMRDSEKHLLGYLGVAIDITQRKQSEAGLLALARAAEQISVAKSQFVANMSHEIRTPMNAVLGMLELIRRSDLTASQRDHVDKATHAGKALLSLLNDVLDFSRIDAGRLELDPHPFEPELLLRELAGVLIGNSLGKAVEVLFDVSREIPPVIIGDRLRIQQVLVNLAGNAIKFTKEGNVIIALEVLAKTETLVRLRLSVRDTGIGIPPDQLASIFDSFTQAEASVARRYGGSGLGLAISTRLVGLMGSELKVESEPGRGSCFWFDADFGYEAAEASQNPDTGAVLNGTRVLIVDDNAASREILSKLCGYLGCCPDTAADAASALAMVRQTKISDAPYSVVLMDMRMPEMDGFETAAIIAADPDNTMPVIIVSAYAADGLRAAMREKNTIICDFLGKPVMLADLRRVLLQAIQPTRAAALRPVVAASTRPLDGMRLLVVEDNELNRQVAFELLRSEGASVDLAEGGAEGVTMATSPGANYTAVLMDMQMPDVDGLEATRRLRRTTQGALVPILAMTANVSSEDVAACLAAGMDGHIAKPFDIGEVVTRIIDLAGLHAVSQRIVAPPPAEGDRPDIDLNGALRRMKGDARLYRQMLERFRREAQELLDKLARPGTDLSARAGQLHALRGLAMMVGADLLARRLLDEEQQCRAGQAARPIPGTELDRLTHTAIAGLEEALAACSPAAPEVATASPNGVSRSAWLSELLPLLETGNLRALDLIETLPQDIARTELAGLIDLIGELRFADAARIARGLQS